jgi:hypothetical protein
MVLYAVKTKDGYLRDKKQEGVFLVEMAAASVYPQLESAVQLKEKYGEGRLVELTLTERLL